MKTIFLIFCLCACAGCRKSDGVATNPNIPQAIRYNIVVIEGCQYLATTTYGGYETLCHKGNCTNAIHGHER